MKTEGLGGISGVECAYLTVRAFLLKARPWPAAGLGLARCPSLLHPEEEEEGDGEEKKDEEEEEARQRWAHSTALSGVLSAGPGSDRLPQIKDWS